MSLSKYIKLTISDYSMKLSSNLNFYVNDCLDLIFELNKWGVDNKNSSDMGSNSSFDLTGISAQLFIENSKFVDYIEATKIEDNKIIFRLTNKYTILSGTGRMQIRLVDDDGCELKLPAFSYNIQPTINELNDKNPNDELILVSEKGSALLNEDGQLFMMSIKDITNNPNLVKISDLPEANSVSYEDYMIVNNQGVTKKVPVREIKISEEQIANIAKVPILTEQLDTIVLEKADNLKVDNVQQQVNNLVLGAVGDGNNAEVLQARGKYSVLNERLNANENDFNDFTNNIGATSVTRGKNVLFLKDQHFENNGLTVDIKDQLITVSGKVTSTGSHNYFELDVDMPKLLDGAYSVYVKVSDGQSITGRNDVLRLRFYNNDDVQVAEKSAFNHLSLTDIIFSNLSNYKVKLMIQAQYTYTQPWSFNLQLAKGHDGVYEKAYVNRKYELNIEEAVSRLENDVNIIKSELGIDESENPLSKIITDGGLAGLIESYACCGDSLTQGVFDRTNGVAMDFKATSFNSYPSQLSRITGSNVFNLGNAGATACNSTQSISEWHSWLQTANQKKWFTDEFKPKAYIFSIGTNDIGYYGSFTGDVETDIDINDYNNNNTTTSVGGLATMIQKARELQPKAVIFIETIDNTRNAKITRDEANEKIRAIANKLDCYLIDMAKYWIQEDEVSEWMAKYQNGGHLNAMGYLLKTQARITYIDWIIKNNPEKFKEVQFIGTTMEYK